MLTISLHDYSSRLLGATLGQAVCRDVLVGLEQQGEAEPFALLDFEGVTETNGSFLKSTLVYLFACGRLFSERKANSAGFGELWEPRPLGIFPFVARTSEPVSDELTDYFDLRRMPFVVAEEYDLTRVSTSRVCGQMDPALSDTLTILIRTGPASAAELSQRLPDRGIGATAWNNRLFDLYASRLVRRQRRGKEWIYSPLTERTAYGSLIPKS